MKRCLLCSELKPAFDFYLQDPSRPNGPRKGHCKECLKKKSKKWGRDNPKRASEICRSYRKRHPDRRENLRLLHEYGITLEEKRELFRRQGGKCAACNEVKKLDVDHCHTTGRVRGLLCRQCNTALGLLKESAKTISALLTYLLDP